MNPIDISKAENPDLSALMAALRRLSKAARDLAIQTNTAIVVVENGRLVRKTAEQLRQEMT